MKALFTLTIGPVKSFVENGRKMRDLYAGSSILSELTLKAIEYFDEQEGVNVVFPPNNQGANVPNRLVVDIENYDKARHKKLAENLKAHVKNEFRKICEKSFKDLSKEATLEIAYAQLEHFLEVYWLFETYISEDQYVGAYKDMIFNTQAIKGIRQFSQLNEPQGRKCSLHPEYNAIFIKGYKSSSKAKKVYPAYTNTEHKIDIPEHTKFKYDIKPKEGLSAIALVKRMYQKKDSEFVSIREMVFKQTLRLKTKSDAWFEKNIKSNDVIKAQSLTVTHLVNAIYDVWEEGNNKSLDYNPMKHEYSEAVMEEGRRLRDKLKEEHKEFQIQQYYTLLKFDGDSMGKKYSALSTKDDHTILSKEICEFARVAKTKIEEVGGLCVYAGGEDVLAVLPLEKILSVLQELHEEFGKLDEKINIPIKDPFTFSAGIAIAHLMQPLKDVINQVNKSEKQAKKDKHGEKNAFAISLMKRGSETRMIKYSFANEYAHLNAFTKLIRLFNDDKNSRSFVYNLSHLLKKLSKKTDCQMIQSLIKQAIDHQQIKDKSGVEQCLVCLYEHEDIDKLMNTLDIVGFLSGKTILQNKEVGADDL